MIVSHNNHKNSLIPIQHMGNILETIGLVDDNVSSSSGSTQARCLLSSREQVEFKSLLPMGLPLNDAFSQFLQNSFKSTVFPEFPKVLHAHLLSKNNMSDMSEIEELFGIVMRSNTENLLMFVYQPLDAYFSEVNGDSPNEMKTMVYFLAIVIEYAFCSEDAAMQFEAHLFFAVANRMNDCYRHYLNSNSQDQSLQSLISWLNHAFPCLPRILQEKLHEVCFPNISPPLDIGFRPPKSISNIINDVDLLPLACISPALQGAWHKLYSSELDGRSFNRIAHHIIGYESPTVVIIRCANDEGTVIGAYCGAWKDSNRFHGTRDNFLFTLLPNLKIYRTSGREMNYQWLNTISFGLPHGLGFGGSREKQRLWISDSLEECHAIGLDMTYETGQLLPHAGKFDIETIEIFGPGGEEVVDFGLRGQGRKRKDTEAMLKQARKVDKAQFCNSSFDQEFLLPKTFQHKVRVADDV